MNSAERTTVGSSPIPSAEAICQLCGPFFGLRQLSREDISAVYPLLMLGRGLEPSREARAVVHEQMRPALPPRAERYARSKRHLRANRPPVAQRPPPSALEALAECALEQATTQFLPGARLTAESSDCDDEHGESLLSSPPTEHTPAIVFDGAGARNECRPDSASSLPSPPLSPQLGSRKRAVPPTRHLANAKKSRECISCGTRQTPCWRPSWDSRQGQLCNSCGLRFRKSRARCVSPDCRRIPARSELAEARTRAGAHHPVCCRDCGCALLFYSK